ncbi:MAG: helicase-related protein [Evtepia sp.]|uniref:helicase-related protein n=1 Tax=Evtepia sp. TaxID=2773933 RepID=UPI002A759048|nr:helicase-related protein [Evtepia sp.]MDY3014979.1 helicase-related protein [Evtepia sp.]
MAKRTQGNLWSPSLLKSRGWNRELMAQLLPRPRYRRINGRSVPLWHRDDVRAAEAKPLFQQRARKPAQAHKADPSANAAATQTVALLEKAWEARPREDSLSQVLAGHYHQVIRSHIPGAASGRALRSSQISGYLTQFSALAHGCDSDQLPGILTHFVQAAPWLGENPTAPLAVQILSAYPAILLGAAQEAKDLLLRIIDSCGDTWEVEHHQRKTPLLCMTHTVDYTRIQPGDALITFSKIGVLSVAEDLRQSGKEPAIIYGALPYSTRRKQMEGFLSGEMDYVVSTDAIGMGLNLPIRRIIFMDTEKFDGIERRELKPEEIQQIAGRAGRYGIYDKGYVGATQNLGAIRAGLNTVVPPLQHAVAGFSDLVLTVDFDLLEVLTEWNKMPTADPYVKLDISRYLTIISKVREKGFSLSKEQELRAANIPFDETEEPLRDLFFHFLRLHQQGQEIQQPDIPPDLPRTLPELELYCRKLDLYFSFAKAFQCPVDEDLLYDRREEIADEINEILLHRLKNNIRFCAQCGAALPLHHHGRLCEACFRKKRRNTPPSWRRT